MTTYNVVAVDELNCPHRAPGGIPTLVCCRLCADRDVGRLNVRVSELEAALRELTEAWERPGGDPKRLYSMGAAAHRARSLLGGHHGP